MARRFHQVPTHIGTPEPVLSMGPLTLSARQFLLLGGALSYHKEGAFWPISPGVPANAICAWSR